MLQSSLTSISLNREAMSTFQMPFSSSASGPSTPGSKPLRGSRSGFADSLASNPSTTPAGPPPSSAASFTPLGPPPSTLFGSSQLSSLKSSPYPFQNTSGGQSRSPKVARSSRIIGKATRASTSSYRSQQTAATKNAHDAGSDPWSPDSDRFAFYDPKQQRVADSAMFDDIGSVHGENEFNFGISPSTMSFNGNGTSFGGSYAAKNHNGTMPGVHSNGLSSSFGAAPPRGAKRSRGGALITGRSLRAAQDILLPRPDSGLTSIAKDMARQIGGPITSESDDFLIDTEDVVDALCRSESDSGIDRASRSGVRISQASALLCHAWSPKGDKSDNASTVPKSAMLGIGSSVQTSSLEKATFIGSLLLQIHHPPPAKGKQAFDLDLKTSSNSAFSSAMIERPESKATALPKVLLDWLENNHNSWGDVTNEVKTTLPSPTSHCNYWDVVLSLMLRGKIQEARRLFEAADFASAETAPQDRQPDGYTDVQISNAHFVVSKAIEMLGKCPAVTEEDWNVTGNDWAIFRKLVEGAMNELVEFAEGDVPWPESDETDLGLWRSTLKSSTLSHTQVVRRAASRVPWTVYQSLRTMYRVLLGGTAEIVSSARDWIEATIGLTVWWDGDEESVATTKFQKSKPAFHRSRSRGRRLVDIDPELTYQDRLGRCFDRVTDDADEDAFQINTLDSVEVALALVFESNFQGVMSLIHSWSLPVACALAEISTLGGWFGSALPSANLMDGFDESDSTVLGNNGQTEEILRRDTIMIEYANALRDRGNLHSQKHQVWKQGWEISIALFSRLGDANMSRQEMRKLLESLPVEKNDQVEKILRICHYYGMEATGRIITEAYADRLAETANDYGTALVDYARARSTKKVKAILDMLVSLSLSRSAAFPPFSDLDIGLRNLLQSPEKVLSKLALDDAEAAAMLHKSLTGYATLRKFYEMRDGSPNGETSTRAAVGGVSGDGMKVAALLTIIDSAADNIYGGLYDESRQAVVPVDGLLALLGEAMVFVNQAASLLTLEQCLDLLRAIEDLQTAPSYIYDRCEMYFRSTLESYRGKGKPLSPRELLREMSGATSTSSFMLVSMVNSQDSDDLDNGMEVDREEAEEQPRQHTGRDWRAGMASNAKGEDVLRILRLGLAKEMARHWIQGSAGQG